MLEITAHGSTYDDQLTDAHRQARDFYGTREYQLVHRDTKVVTEQSVAGDVTASFITEGEFGAHLLPKHEYDVELNGPREVL